MSLYSLKKNNFKCLPYRVLSKHLRNYKYHSYVYEWVWNKNIIPKSITKLYKPFTNDDDNYDCYWFYFVVIKQYKKSIKIKSSVIHNIHNPWGVQITRRRRNWKCIRGDNTKVLQNVFYLFVWKWKQYKIILTIFNRKIFIIYQFVLLYVWLIIIPNTNVHTHSIHRKLHCHH